MDKEEGKGVNKLSDNQAITKCNDIINQCLKSKMCYILNCYLMKWKLLNIYILQLTSLNSPCSVKFKLLTIFVSKLPCSKRF